jgi:hypothetical protein
MLLALSTRSTVILTKTHPTEIHNPDPFSPLMKPPAIVRAQDLASADFSSPSYTDGALAGQNGWAQYNTQSTLPLTVTNGRVSWPGGATVNNQDAFLPFPAQPSRPKNPATAIGGIEGAVLRWI